MARGEEAHDQATSSHNEAQMERVEGSGAPPAQPFNQQEYIQMIEEQRRLLHEEKLKNEERYLTLETLVRQILQNSAGTASSTSNQHVPAMVSQQTGLPPPVTATHISHQPAIEASTAPMPAFYPGMHMSLPGVTSTPLSTGQVWPSQQQPQSTGFFTGSNGFNMASQPIPLPHNTTPWVQPWVGQATTHAAHTPSPAIPRTSNPVMVSTSNTFQQVSQLLPNASGFQQASAMPTPPMAAPILPAVEVSTRAPAADPRIDQLIQVVAEMKASIEKEDSCIKYGQTIETTC